MLKVNLYDLKTKRIKKINIFKATVTKWLSFLLNTFCRVYRAYVNRLLINVAEIVYIGGQSLKLVFLLLHRACCRVTKLSHQPLHIYKIYKIYTLKHEKCSDMFRS